MDAHLGVELLDPLEREPYKIYAHDDDDVTATSSHFSPATPYKRWLDVMNEKNEIVIKGTHSKMDAGT